MIASIPCSTAILASSAVMTPLSTMGSVVMERNHSMSDQVMGMGCGRSQSMAAGVPGTSPSPAASQVKFAYSTPS